MLHFRDGFRLFCFSVSVLVWLKATVLPFHTPSNTEPLDARDFRVASYSRQVDSMSAMATLTVDTLLNTKHYEETDHITLF